MDSIDQFAKVGTEAALEAGRLLMRHFRTKFSIAHKGDINIVTELDVAAEKHIVSRILEAFPTHSVLAEENHPDAARTPFTWIIDPLDGTTNYAHGLSVFFVSVRVESYSGVERR